MFLLRLYFDTFLHKSGLSETQTYIWSLRVVNAEMNKSVFKKENLSCRLYSQYPNLLSQFQFPQVVSKIQYWHLNLFIKSYVAHHDGSMLFDALD